MKKLKFNLLTGLLLLISVNKLNLSFFIMRFFLISSLISNNKRSILFVE